MKTVIFLSYPRPHLKKQQDFINKLKDYLEEQGLIPLTLGVTDYSLDAPLQAIRSMMMHSSGLITIAFKQTRIYKAVKRPGEMLPPDSKIVGILTQEIEDKGGEIKDKWLTSPYCQIEPAMAFQLGLPVLIFRERDVLEEGILDKGVLGQYMPEFDLDNQEQSYFKTEEFMQLMTNWIRDVRIVVVNRGKPPKLF